MITQKQIDGYIAFKLQPYFDRSDANIELPMIQVTDEVLHDLGCAITASPKQKQVIKEQIDVARSNWQAHLRYEYYLAEKRAKADVNAQNKIAAIEKYLLYATRKGYTQQHIDEVVREIEGYTNAK
jgi:hypothetical protein